MINLKRKLKSYYSGSIKNNNNTHVINIWPLIVILLISAVFFYPFWLKGKVPLPADALVGAHVPWIELKWEEYPAGVPIKNQEITDSFSQFYAWRALVGEFWKNGKAPLWNFFMFSGTPFLATWHSAALYPLNLFYLLFSNVEAWSLLVFSQILLSGTFMYLLLRELKRTKAASLIGGLAFMFSGYMIAWLEFATGGHAGLWLPLLLLLEIRLLRSKNYIWIIPTSITFFFIFTAGDFQVPFYLTLTYFLFGIFFTLKESEKLKLKIIAKVTACWILGVMLSAPQLFPAIELYLSSVRLNDPYIREYFFGIMHWEKITLFIWPDFFGNVVTRNYWGKFGFHEYITYVGTIPFMLVVLSALKQKASYEKFFWILLIFSLLFLFPTPLAFLPYKLNFPGLGTSSASRIIFLVDFALAVLAAYGMDKFLKMQTKFFSRIGFYFLVVTAGVYLGLLISGYILTTGVSDGTLQAINNLKVSMRNMILSTLVVFAATFIAVTFSKKNKFVKLASYFFILMTIVDLLHFAWKNTPFSPREFVFPETKITQFLRDKDEVYRIAGGIPLNLHMPFKLYSAEGYDPIYPKINSEWYSLVNSGDLKSLSGRYGLIHNFSSDLIDFANVKYVIDYKKNIYGEISERGEYGLGISEPGFKEVFQEGRVKVFENQDFLPYAWISSDFEISQSQDDLVEKTKSLEGGGRKVILENISFKETYEEVSGEVEGIFKNYNEILINTKSDGEGLLFLSESYYPGWVAYIDGVESKIYKANYIFQAIKLPAGTHKVRFIYKPLSFTIGLGISVSALVILTTLLVYENKFKIRKRTS